MAHRIPSGPDFMRAYNATMTLFAARSTQELERPVYDQTGLKGAFDFKLSTLRTLRSSEGPSVFTAIQRSGLADTYKRPVAHLVTEHAEKPSEN